jgi:hypothetical protein
MHLRRPGARIPPSPTTTLPPPNPSDPQAWGVTLWCLFSKSSPTVPGCGWRPLRMTGGS